MLSKFREKFPQYDDMDDKSLAEALHRKHYPDMDKDEFMSKVCPHLMEAVDEAVEEVAEEIEIEPEKEKPEIELPDFAPMFAKNAEAVKQAGETIARTLRSIPQTKVDTASIANAIKTIPGVNLGGIEQSIRGLAAVIPDTSSIPQAIQYLAESIPSFQTGNIVRALDKIAESNIMVAEAIKPQPPVTWTFTVSRDKYGSISSIKAVPDE